MRIRKARSSDVPSIATLINANADVGNVLPREEEEIYEVLRDFLVAECEGEVVGCCSLKLMDENLAEVRSLVVKPESQGLGLGRELVEGCLAEAAHLGISHVFALTALPLFFENLGFSQAPRSRFPQKIWRDCFKCKFFESCGEVAVEILLEPGAPARGPEMEEGSGTRGREAHGRGLRPRQ